MGVKMLKFTMGGLLILIIFGSLAVSAEYQHKADRSVVHWLYGYSAGIISAFLIVAGIWG